MSCIAKQQVSKHTCAHELFEASVLTTHPRRNSTAMAALPTDDINRFRSLPKKITPGQKDGIWGFTGW